MRSGRVGAGSRDAERDRFFEEAGLQGFLAAEQDDRLAGQAGVLVLDPAHHQPGLVARFGDVERVRLRDHPADGTRSPADREPNQRTQAVPAGSSRVPVMMA